MRNRTGRSATRVARSEARSSSRRGVRLLAAVVVLGLGLTVAASSWAAPSASAEEFSLDPVEARFLQLTNETRAQQGLAPLVVDPALTGVARSWAAKMSGDGMISHRPDLSGVVTAKWTKLGENVGSGPEADLVQQKFLESPTHFRNIVDPAYTTVGIGIARLDGLVFVAVDFMAVRATPATTVPKALALKATSAGRAPVTTTTVPKKKVAVRK